MCKVKTSETIKHDHKTCLNQSQHDSQLDTDQVTETLRITLFCNQSFTVPPMCQLMKV